MVMPISRTKGRATATDGGALTEKPGTAARKAPAKDARKTAAKRPGRPSADGEAPVESGATPPAPARGAKKKKAGKKPSRRATPESVAAAAAGKSLVIVDSPTKSRTLTKFLGRGFSVLASNGHIMDLPKSELGVD